MTETSTAPAGAQFDVAQSGATDRKGAAAYISCSTRTLDDLLSAGSIPKLKLGRKTLIRFSDLDAYLASLVVKDSK